MNCICTTFSKLSGTDIPIILYQY
uniref:Uncharacterized protein n=1 Tax=Anguilla anguilla TaxID=7936 RepID=A0A0E9S4U9_ANGAN